MKKPSRVTFDMTPLEKLKEKEKVVFEIPEVVDMETALKEFGDVAPIKDDDKEKKPYKRRSKKKKKVDPNEVYSV